jgi:predicted phosphodiesterase
MKANANRVFEGIRRLGVIGDVHARLELLERAADALHAIDVDTLVCVGDIYGPGNGTAGCCRLLQERQILTVRGNHDRWFVEAADRDDRLRASVGSEAVEFLAALPITLNINTAAGPVLVCHGVGTNDLAHVPQTFPHSFVRRSIRVGLIPPRCKLVVHGHSHLQRQQTCEGVLFVTIGALRSHPAGGCIMVDTNTGIASPIAY